MRKAHVKVVLNVFVNVDDKVNDLAGCVSTTLTEVDLTGECGAGFGGSVNIQGVDVISSEVIDSQ